jgi:phospholipid/cholesterol/gamma-HCH transport system substrate-binding protein
LALAGAIVTIAIVVTGSGSSYVLNARFDNAGGLVYGGLVEIAGRTVGSISSISLTPNGEANVKLSIDDPGMTPMHLGTRASIQAVGQGTITNNYVLLSPGTTTRPTIPSGGVLPLEQTSGIVPIDALLDSFGPAQRRNLDALVQESAQIYAGSGAATFNRMLDELDPALGKLDGFTGELALDRPALAQLVQTAATATSAVAARQADLQQAISNTAVGLGALASRRRSLNDVLARMPAFFDQARGTMARAQSALLQSNAALRDTPAAAGPLRRFLSATDATLPAAASAVSALNAQLPSLDRGLQGLLPLQHPAVSALRSLGPAMKGLRPILKGVRYYGTDLVVGLFGSLLALTTGEYDALGHYVKVNFIQSPQTVVAGSLSTLLSENPLVPGTFATRTGLTRRCPGGDQPPAPDGSNPWLIGSKYCTPSDDTPLSVNFP